MFQTLWFFIKIVALIALLGWVITLSGETDIEILEYNIKAPTNILLLILLGSILILFFTYKIIKGIFSIPQVISKTREESRHQKGYNALTRGLVAVAAGDSKQATYFARRAQNLLPNFKEHDNGGAKALHLLLEAQSARLRGEDAVAQNRFETLMLDKDAGFLGIRGLLKTAMDNGNYRLALEHAEHASKLYPNQTWVLQTLYDLQIKNKRWDDVLKTAHKMKKTKTIETDKIQSDEVAIHLMRFDDALNEGYDKIALNHLKAAYKIDDNFVPTITRYAEYYIAIGKPKKAASFIKKTWSKNPHPDLGKIWDKLAPSAEKTDTKRLQWYKKLVDINPADANSHILAARAAIDLSLWGEARAYLITAQKIMPSAQIFRLLATIEQNSSHNEESIHDLMEKAASALPDKVWICAQTGMIYEEWTAIATPHDSFNTVIWQYPGVASMAQREEYALKDQESFLIESV